MADEKTIWESALIPGLAIAAIPTAYTLLGWLLGSFGLDGIGQAFLKSAAAGLLWAAKVFGCIMLFRFFLLRFTADTGSNAREAFRFGLAVSVLSSLIYAGFYMAYLTYIAPDTIQSVFDALQDQFADNGIDSGTIEQIKSSIPTMPRKMFFAQLFYGILFGAVLSSILTKKIK